MKSFTASTPLGAVRVRLPDDDQPSVLQSGRILAAGIPTVVAPDAEVDGALVCFPNGTWYGRKASSVARGEERWEDETDVAQTGAALIVDGVGALWGCRPPPRGHTFTGYSFTDGAAQIEAWEVVMEPQKRACCGRPSTTTPPTIPLLALAVPLV